MPAVAGGNQHGVDIRALGQELADVARHGTVGVPVLRVHQLLDRFAPAAVDVADRQELHVRFDEHFAQHGLAATAQPDAAQQDPLARGAAAAP